MAALTLEEIAAKIATAESGFAATTSQYDRTVFAQIRDEYKRYAAERAALVGFGSSLLGRVMRPRAVPAAQTMVTLSSWDALSQPC